MSIRFYKIYIEISDICHLSCSFCTPKKEQRGTMPIWLFERIIMQIADQTKLVSLHVLGDPLCNENLASYIEIAKSYNVRLDIVSSGVFLQEKHFALLCKDNIHQVSFSLDAFYDKGNQRIANNISKEVYFTRLIAFYKYARVHAPWLYINIRLFGDYDYGILLDEFKDFIPQDSKRRLRLDRNFLLRFHKEFKWHKKGNKNAVSHEESSKIHAKPYCLGGIRQLGILADGVVVPCCIDANAFMPLGDLKIQSFPQILECEAMQAFLHAQYTHINLPPPCQTCTFRGV